MKREDFNEEWARKEMQMIYLQNQRWFRWSIRLAQLGVLLLVGLVWFLLSH